MRRRPYLFEVVLLLNAIFVVVIARDNALATLLESVINGGLAAVAATLIGVVVRLVVAWRRGHARRYLRIISSPLWLTDTLRIVVGMVVLAETYGWIKLLVPVLHPVLYDEALYRLDQTICFGISPTIFFLQLFSQPLFLHFIDHVYAYFFLGGMVFAMSFFFSMPRRRVRITFMTSNVVMWLAGAWLYMLIPSLGPAYRFPDIWFAYAKELSRTQGMQALLMRNYHTVIGLARSGGSGKVILAFGIAAFPSLHVGTQALIAIGMKKAWRPGAAIFAIALFFVFIGSMITGWHYLVDGLAGVALAAASYVASQRAVRKEFRPSRARF